MGSGMHHKLLLLVVICFCDYVRHDMRMLRKQCLVVNFFPLELLSELRVAILGLRYRAHPWEAEILKMQVTNKIYLSIYRS